MKFKSLATGLLAATLAMGPLATPALADGGASTRNILLGLGAAAGFGITNYNHKKKIKEQENQQNTVARLRIANISTTNMATIQANRNIANGTIATTA